MKTSKWIMVAVMGLVSVGLALGCEPATERLAGSPGEPPRGLVVEKMVEAERVADGGEVATSIERKIVRNADMSVVVDDVDRTVSEVNALVAQEQGFVVRSSRFGQGDEERASISFRVPSVRLDATLSRLRQLANIVENEQISTSDVTEEFIDTEARLKSLRATEAKYLDLLTQADTVEDTLNVQRELENIRYRVESTEGRLRFLRQTTTLSLVNLQIAPSERAKPLVVGGWDISDIATSAVRGLIGTGLFVASALIWVAIFVPIWAPLVFGVRWLLRRRRRQNQRGSADKISQPPNGL